MREPKNLDAYLAKLDELFFAEWDEKMLAEIDRRVRLTDTKIKAYKLKIDLAKQIHLTPSQETITGVNP